MWSRTTTSRRTCLRMNLLVYRSWQTGYPKFTNALVRGSRSRRRRKHFRIARPLVRSFRRFWVWNSKTSCQTRCIHTLRSSMIISIRLSLTNNSKISSGVSFFTWPRRNILFHFQFHSFTRSVSRSTIQKKKTLLEVENDGDPSFIHSPGVHLRNS